MSLLLGRADQFFASSGPQLLRIGHPSTADEASELIRALSSELSRFGGGVGIIASERQRQIEREGYDAAHDSEHDPKELIDAARAYLHAERSLSGAARMWPWGVGFKPTTLARNLAKAGALIAAALDRLGEPDPSEPRLQTEPQGVAGTISQPQEVGVPAMAQPLPARTLSGCWAYPPPTQALRRGEQAAVFYGSSIERATSGSRLPTLRKP